MANLEIEELEILKKILALRSQELARLAYGKPNIQREISSYLIIKKGYEERAIDDLFRRTFKWFYKVDSAGLGDTIKVNIFELIEQGESDLEKILSAIYDIPTIQGHHSIQLSFSTKILHTVDNTMPIYDNNVSRLLRLRRVASANHAKSKRIESGLDVYNDLKRKFDYILSSDVGDNLIERFYGMNIEGIKNIPKAKALDFCFWILGA